ELGCRADEAIAVVARAALVHAIEPGEADARQRQRLRLHRPPLQAETRRARDPPPPRRLPRPRAPGLHREPAPATQTKGAMAERARDARRRTTQHRRLRRPPPPPTPLRARPPDTARGAPDPGKNNKTSRPNLTTPAGSRSPDSASSKARS